MAYDEYTAERVNRILKDRKANYFAKKMFAGLVFMIDEKMACGVHFDKKKETDLLMARMQMQIWSTISIFVFNLIL